MASKHLLASTSLFSGCVSAPRPRIRVLKTRAVGMSTQIGLFRQVADDAQRGRAVGACMGAVEIEAATILLHNIDEPRNLRRGLL